MKLQDIKNPDKYILKFKYYFADYFLTGKPGMVHLDEISRRQKFYGSQEVIQVENLKIAGFSRTAAAIRRIVFIQCSFFVKTGELLYMLKPDPGFIRISLNDKSYLQLEKNLKERHKRIY